jgi:hypothetical protein
LLEKLKAEASGILACWSEDAQFQAIGLNPPDSVRSPHLNIGPTRMILVDSFGEVCLSTNVEFEKISDITMNTPSVRTSVYPQGNLIKETEPEFVNLGFTRDDSGRN